MSQLFSESLGICDERWLKSLINHSVQKLGHSIIFFNSQTNTRQLLDRFSSCERIIIHWECYHRRGGHLVEEILEKNPDFNIAEKVIVLTTNPTKEDIYYFHELGLTRMIRLNQSKKSQEAALKEIMHHFTTPLKEPSAKLKTWQKIQSAIDKLKSNTSLETITRIDEAIEQINLNAPKSAVATYYDAKASITAAQHQNAKAEELWLAAIEANPHFFRSYDNLINFYETNDQYDKALNVMHRLNKLNRHKVSRIAHMGEIHQKLDQLPKAEHYYNLALGHDKNCNRALNGLATIKFEQGQLDDARQLLTRSTSSDSAAAHFNRQGIKLARSKQFKKALDLYKNAQYVLPSQHKGPLLFYNIGLCYFRWGKFDMAREYLRLAIIKNPSYQKAKDLLQRLSHQIKNPSKAS